jgi:hypothetical protein
MHEPDAIDSRASRAVSLSSRTITNKESVDLLSFHRHSSLDPSHARIGSRILLSTRQNSRQRLRKWKDNSGPDKRCGMSLADVRFRAIECSLYQE